MGERNVTFDVQIIEEVLFLLWSKLAARHGRPWRRKLLLG
jgi:hypothetical protein